MRPRAPAGTIARGPRTRSTSRAMSSAWGRRGLPAVDGAEIDPEQLQLFGLERGAPGRHGTHALVHRAHEALLFVAGKGAQVEADAVGHEVDAVATLARADIELAARLDLRRACRGRGCRL